MRKAKTQISLCMRTVWSLYSLIILCIAMDAMRLQAETHYENTPIQIYWKFYNQKRTIFRLKKSDIFHIFLLKT